MSQQRVLELLRLLGGSGYAADLAALAASLDGSDSLGKNGALYRGLNGLHKWGIVEFSIGEHGRLFYRLSEKETPRE